MMDCKLSRRGMLRFLMMALPATLCGFKRADYFDDELVCVHVYPSIQDLPTPLTKAHQGIQTRRTDGAYFNVGLPELVICETQFALLDLFQYFWPISRQEIARLQDEIKIHYQIRQIESLPGIEEKLRHQRQQRGNGSALAAILTLNDFTLSICPPLVDICRRYDLNELVVFKDPSQPPYLCSYPSKQKGFKKPPPI